MKLSLNLITWFIISIPAGILLGRFCAAGNGFLADSVGGLVHCCVQVCHSDHFSLKPHPTYEHSMGVYFYGTNAFTLLHFA